MPQKGYWINQRPATPVNAYNLFALPPGGCVNGVESWLRESEIIEIAAPKTVAVCAAKS
ncbi:unnamed protein product [Gemmata massiliana]|uniref:Uncharacterized protein n=1 Tax=Gemmata massiliana TaxID=1210884 RepID=A0A6P2CZN3_9BACT|nr:unnamed protein product [Gemmata massiliana]